MSSTLLSQKENWGRVGARIFFTLWLFLSIGKVWWFIADILFHPPYPNLIFIWKSPVDSVLKKRALSAQFCSGPTLAEIFLPCPGKERRFCFTKYWGTWMGQHCFINMKWDYSPAVVSLLSTEPLKHLQNSKGFQLGGAIVADHPVGTSGNGLCTWPM